MRLCSGSFGIADSEKKKEEEDEDEDEDEEEDDYRNLKKKSLHALTRAGERLLKKKIVYSGNVLSASPSLDAFRPIFLYCV